MLVSSLQTVQDAQDLCGVAAGGGRVTEDEADGLLGVDDEDGADGESDALLVDVCCVFSTKVSLLVPTMREKKTLLLLTLVVQHVIQVADFALLVGYDGELEVAA